MAQPDRVTVLLICDQAEDVKQISITLRTFYPGCRIEAVYSPAEGLEWASKESWRLILLDEPLLEWEGANLLPDLRHRASSSAIVVRLLSQVVLTASRLLHVGADYCLFGGSPSFLAELPLAVSLVFEKRRLQGEVESRTGRHRTILELIPHIIYELDSEGRFTSLSPSVTQILGIQPRDLVGSHFTTIVHDADRSLAAWQFNERRTGPRATKNVRLRLVRVSGESGQHGFEPFLINASGLYDDSRRYLGTIGMIRPFYQEAARTEGGLELRDSALPSHVPHLRPHDLALQHDQQAAADPHQAKKPSSPAARAIFQSPPSAPNAAYSPMRNQEVLQEPRPPSPATTSPNTIPFKEALPGETVEGKLSAPPEPIKEPSEGPRAAIRAPATATLGDSIWEGVTLSISRDALALAFPEPLPITRGRRARVALVSEAGTLELNSEVARLAGPSDTAPIDPKHPTHCLTLNLSPNDVIESQVLDSLIDGLREQPIRLQVTVTFLPGPAQDFSSPQPHLRSGFIRYLPAQVPPVEGDAAQGPEHRLEPRVNISIPAQLEHAKSGPGWPRSGHLCNLSVTGACMTIPGSVEKFEPEVLIRLTVPVSLHAKTSTSPGPKAEYALRGTVIWVRPDHEGSAWTKGGRANSVRVGIWFRPGQEEDRGRLATLVGSMMASPMRMAGRSEKTSILTALLDCNTAEGKRLSLCHDFPRDPLAPGSPVAVIVPNFGETKRHYIALGYYLAANGYQVLRYDHPDHPGESEGSPLKPTLTSFSQALRAVLEFAERQWPVSPLTVIAAGMSGRVAVKTLPSFKKVRLLVLLNGVFDVQASLLNAHQEDLLQIFTEGTRRGVTNILGQNIDSDLFLDDAIRGGFANFQTTLRDAEQLKTEIALFSPKEGLWVNREHLHQLQQALRSSPIQWFVYPDDLPHSMEYPEQNRAMLRQTVDCVTERLYPLTSTSPVREPSWQVILQQQQLESGRIRALHWLPRARMLPFWADYLNHFDHIVNFPDYWKMLDDAHRALQLSGEHKILDAGCGNGNFGLFLMITESYASRQKTPGPPPRYIGLDFVPTAVRRGRNYQRRGAAEFRVKHPGPVMPPSTMNHSFVLADLNKPLPYRDGQLSHVLCNLTLGYLLDPLFSLRELVRILALNGKLVVTTLVPKADLLKIYRNFLNSPRESDDFEQGKWLLSSFGMITSGETTGWFRNFSREELREVLQKCGLETIRISSTFSNQALLAVAQKPKS